MGPEGGNRGGTVVAEGTPGAGRGRPGQLHRPVPGAAARRPAGQAAERRSGDAARKTAPAAKKASATKATAKKTAAKKTAAKKTVRRSRLVWTFNHHPTTPGIDHDRDRSGPDHRREHRGHPPDDAPRRRGERRGPAVAGCVRRRWAAADDPSSGSGGSDWAAADVPEGGGTILADQEVVVTQPTKGVFKAFTAICTHQGCTVTKVADGAIVCPCHGSRSPSRTAQPWWPRHRGRVAWPAFKAVKIRWPWRATRSGQLSLRLELLVAPAAPAVQARRSMTRKRLWVPRSAAGPARDTGLLDDLALGVAAADPPQVGLDRAPRSSAAPGRVPPSTRRRSASGQGRGDVALCATSVPAGAQCRASVARPSASSAGQ